MHLRHTLKAKATSISLNFTQPPPLTPLHTEIIFLEEQILKFDDNKSLNLCENTKAWTFLNSEKPTKRFCALNKSLNEDASLSHIKKLGADGDYRNFLNNNELNPDLVNFLKIFTAWIKYYCHSNWKEERLKHHFNHCFFSIKLQLFCVPMRQDSMGEDGPYRGVQ